MDRSELTRSLAATIESLYGDLMDYPLLDPSGPAHERTSAPAEFETQTPTEAPSHSLASLAEAIRYCQDCSLHIGRRNLVFGRGEPSSPLAFVGDLPSLADDTAGLPFSDEAGDLLGKMIVAMKRQPEGVYLTNFFKCRPPQGQRPEQEHFRACEMHLKQQFQNLGAQVIVALGESASKAFARSEAPLRVLRGQQFEWEGRTVFCTHHPRDLLTSPALKKEAWDDLQSVMRFLGGAR